MTNTLKVLIVSENVSLEMGGEASLPFYYFKLFRQRGLDPWLVCHERVKTELEQAFSTEELKKVYFAEDTTLQIAIYRLGTRFPYRIKDLIFGQLVHWLTQGRLRKIVQDLIASRGIQIILEPSPITPKGVSFMYGLGIPVVIGPLCGGLEFPPAFRYMDSFVSRISIDWSRFFSALVHRLIPGKLQADTLIVANPRTADALPKGYQGKVYQVTESGVDLKLWATHPPQERDNPPVRFVYSGRFVDWKGIQFLVQAFQSVAAQTDAVLELIGSGELREQIEAQITQLNLQNRIILHGWLTRDGSAAIVRECDVFVIPSLRECGGTAILEAMAVGLPIIATNWAGPAEYVDPSCGLLVEPSSAPNFIGGLTEAMLKLARSRELRRQMGKAGQRRVNTNYYDWESKSDRLIEILHETLNRSKLQPTKDHA